MVVTPELNAVIIPLVQSVLTPGGHEAFDGGGVMSKAWVEFPRLVWVVKQRGHIWAV